MGASQQLLLAGIYDAPVLPTDVAGCTGWWDFTNAALLMTTGRSGGNPSGTGVSADGDAIAWAESYPLTGSDTYWYPMTASSTGKPLYKTGIVNGKSVARFDGANDTMDGRKVLKADYTNTDYEHNGEIFTAAAKTVVGAFYVRAAPTDTGNGYGNGKLLGDGGTNRFQLQAINISGSLRISGYNYDGSVDNVNNDAASFNAWFIASFKHDGTDIKVRINGGAWASAASGTTASFTGSCSPGGPPEVDFDIAHLATFNTAVDDSDLTDIEDYIAGELGI